MDTTTTAMTTESQISYFGLVLFTIPAVFLIYLSTAMQKLNSAQIERLFDLEEDETAFRGFRISKIFLGLHFFAIFSEILLILVCIKFFVFNEWNMLSFLKFGLFFGAVEIVSRQILPTAFPMHVRDHLKTWEKWIFLMCGYIFFLPAVLVEKTTLLSQKIVRSNSKVQRLTHAEETIRSIIDAGQKDGVFLSDEGEMLQSIIDLSETIVREVMTPRIDLQAIEIQATIDDLVQKVVATGYSKIPVYKEKVDDVVGVLYAKDVLPYWKKNGHQVTLEELKRDVTFVPETKKISILLREFQHEKKHMAIVVDEFGGVAGLVTIEDLLEEIVGEIHDEYDEESETIRSISSFSWEVAARIDLDELSEEIDVEFPEANYETLGGFLFHLFERIPAPGETQKFENVIFKITKANERRIETVLITKEQEKGQQESKNSAENHDDK
jgi:CBS domain containing-hemolysin-like protein